MEEEKIEENQQENNEDMTNIVKTNPWMISTVALGVIVLVLLFFTLRGGITGNVVSANNAGTGLVTYLNEKTGGGVELNSSKDIGGLYEVTVSYQGQEIPVYTTKDGKYFIQSAIPITGDVVSSTDTTTKPTEVPKTDKPTADLYVFAYCPYGLQTEKGFVPVYNLLKNKVDMNIVYIGAMHGQYEQTESYRQLCILKNYGKDKLMSYIDKFAVDTKIGACGSDETCSKPLVETLMTSMGIDKTKINTCMTNDAPALYQADEAKASSLGISGSPTLVINGVETSAGRSASALLTTICSGFTTAPSECSQTLSTTTPSAGFGASTSSSSSSASCG